MLVLDKMKAFLVFKMVFSGYSNDLKIPLVQVAQICRNMEKRLANCKGL